MGKKEKASAIVMTEGKREIIRQLLSEYDIQTAQDIQELFGSRQRGCSQAGSLCHSGNKMRRTQGSFEHRNRENENAKYWLGVLNSLKNRGLKDILILCADGLTGSLMPSRQHFRRPNSGVVSFIKSEILSSTWRLRTEKISPPT